MVWEDNFSSKKPSVRLINRGDTATAFQTSIAAARSCYSGDPVTIDDVLEDQLNQMEGEKNAGSSGRIAKSTWQAKHHTPYMHTHYTFLLNNISRQLIWSLFHSHPFYNSEQVSQRYKKMTRDNILIPKFKDPKLTKIYSDCLDIQFDAYNKLRDELLFDATAEAYFERFPGRRGKKGSGIAIRKKTQEIARYILPIATHAHMYHTVNGLTLARLYRLCQLPDVPTEATYVVNRMVNIVKILDPQSVELFDQPLPEEELLENRVTANIFAEGKDSELTREFIAEFDESLEGESSKLVSYKISSIHEMYEAVRSMLGLPCFVLKDDEIHKMLFDPSYNTHRSDTLTLEHMRKISKVLTIPHFTFKVKLSHTADSQAQRQRMSPATRPITEYVISDKPDYITPPLITISRSGAVHLYHETMEAIWAARNNLINSGVSNEMANYLLPNAIPIRYYESVDLLNFIQKNEKRECLNAQEEIGNITLNQRLSIEDAHTELKGVFGPPCYIRYDAKIKPFCPEGKLFCGVPVWTKDKNPDVSIENLIKRRII